MTLFIYFFIIIINLYYLFKGKESKIINLVSFVFIVILLAGYGPQYNDIKFINDYDRYAKTYNNLDYLSPTFGAEFGFTFLMVIGKLFNFDFFYFRTFIYIVGFLYLYKFVINKYTSNINFLVAAYLTYFIFIDSEQLQNFIALIIFLKGVLYLVEKEKKSILLFSIHVIIASSFHSSFIFYLIFVFFSTENYKNLYKMAIGSFLVFSILLLNDKKIPFIHLLTEMFVGTRVEKYIGTTTGYGYIIPVMLIFQSIAMIYIVKKIVTSYCNSYYDEDSISLNIDISRKGESINRLLSLVYALNIYSIIFMPLFLFNIHFYRYVRNIFFFNTLLVSIIFKTNLDVRRKRVIFSIFLMNISTWVILDLFFKIGASRLVIPFLTQNILLK